MTYNVFSGTLNLTQSINQSTLTRYLVEAISHYSVATRIVADFPVTSHRLVCVLLPISPHLCDDVTGKLRAFQTLQQCYRDVMGIWTTWTCRGGRSYQQQTPNKFCFVATPVYDTISYCAIQVFPYRLLLNTTF